MWFINTYFNSFHYSLTSLFMTFSLGRPFHKELNNTKHYKDNNYWNFLKLELLFPPSGSRLFDLVSFIYPFMIKMLKSQNSRVVVTRKVSISSQKHEHFKGILSKWNVSPNTYLLSTRPSFGSFDEIALYLVAKICKFESKRHKGP